MHTARIQYVRTRKRAPRPKQRAARSSADGDQLGRWGRALNPKPTWPRPAAPCGGRCSPPCCALGSSAARPMPSETAAAPRPAPLGPGQRRIPDPRGPGGRIGVRAIRPSGSRSRAEDRGLRIGVEDRGLGLKVRLGHQVLGGVGVGSGGWLGVLARGAGSGCVERSRNQDHSTGEEWGA